MGGLYVNDDGAPKEVTGDNTALGGMVISEVEVTMASDGTQSQTLLSNLIPNFTGQGGHCYLLSASAHNANNNGWYNFTWLDPTKSKIGVIDTALRYLTTEDAYKGQKIHAIIGWYK